jgi:hypothetical protein
MFKKILLSSVLFILFIYPFNGITQDSLGIKYSIIGMRFYNNYDVIKVKIPNWLTKSQLMYQLKSVLFWPGDPPPKKKTHIYVFKETDQVSDISDVGCTYSPQNGFTWNLECWEPETIEFTVPSERDLLIYNTLTDTLITAGLTLSNEKIRTEIACKFGITLHELDSIYMRVKYWWEERSKIQP